MPPSYRVHQMVALATSGATAPGGGTAGAGGVVVKHTKSGNSVAGSSPGAGEAGPTVAAGTEESVPRKFRHFYALCAEAVFSFFLPEHML
jgi:hypothetical protein